MRQWLILVYKVPSEPSRLRAAVWRRLKASGAVYLQDGVAALPAEMASERVLRGLAEEIRMMGGTVHLLRAVPMGDEHPLVATFNAAREAEYRELLGRCQDFHAELARERAARNFTFAELEENEDDLAKLEAWRAKIRARDRFRVPLGMEADVNLHACRKDLDAFAATVYQTADHGAASGDNDDDHEGDEEDARRAGHMGQAGQTTGPDETR